MVGSLYIINVASYDEAREFIAGEPLNKAGLFESLMGGAAAFITCPAASKRNSVLKNNGLEPAIYEG